MASDDFDRAVTHGPFAGDTPENTLIVCDCVGTLYQVEGMDGVNTKLIEFLLAAKQIGYEVVVVSSDPVGAQFVLDFIAMELEKPTQFLGEVVRKDLFDGAKAFMVIDDDHRSHNVIVDKRSKLFPTDPKIDTMMAYFRAAIKLPDRSGPKN